MSEWSRRSEIQIGKETQSCWPRGGWIMMAYMLLNNLTRYRQQRIGAVVGKIAWLDLHLCEEAFLMDAHFQENGKVEEVIEELMMEERG